MNNYTVKKYASWKRRYVKLARVGNWLLVPIYIFAVALPMYYKWQYDLPPIEAMNKSEGVLTYKAHGGKIGTKVGLITPAGTEYFTCKSGVSSRHDCPGLYLEKIKPLAGKTATILWADQDVNPMVRQKRLIQLIVDGEERVSIQVTQDSVQRAKISALWMALGLFVLFILLAVYFESGARRGEHGSAAN